MFAGSGEMLLRDVERSLSRMIVLVDHVIAVAEQFARSVGLRSGTPTATEGQDKVLLTTEAATMCHLQHRQALLSYKVPPRSLRYVSYDFQKTQWLDNDVKFCEKLIGFRGN